MGVIKMKIAFLLLNLVIYILVEPKYRNPVLLIFSLIFYAWGGVRYLILLVGGHKQGDEIPVEVVSGDFLYKP